MPSLTELIAHFAVLSLLAFGGGNAMLPEMQRLVVEHYHWMSAATFSELFAVAQAAPGPNVLVVSLIGLQLAGIQGFFAITAAFCLPSSLLMYGFARWWHGVGDVPWRNAVQGAVGPVAVGLVLASGWLMAGAAAGPGQWLPLLLTAATVILVLALRWNPLWWIAAGALLGLGGVV
ncbi:MAG: chromate transporter [Sulfuritalea sp.]|nr:chromate transporter [Sulfuritalea sp.]MDP1981737.1 chromate transporter [Sulfuritalea sp.]